MQCFPAEGRGDEHTAPGAARRCVHRHIRNKLWTLPASFTKRRESLDLTGAAALYVRDGQAPRTVGAAGRDGRLPAGGRLGQPR